MMKTTIVPIIDTSNVVRDGERRAKLHRLTSMIDAFKKFALNPICIADASLWHYIDESERYEKMVIDGRILQAPAGSPADAFIIETAKRLSDKGMKPYFVTNDRELASDGPSLKFLFVPWNKGDELLIFDPPLESLIRAHVKHIS